MNASLKILSIFLGRKFTMFYNTNRCGAALGVAIVASIASCVFQCVGAFHTGTIVFVKSLPNNPSRTLFLQKGWLDNEMEDEEDGLVTREELNRDMLGMEVRRKSRKGKGYKPLDNRDHLPFSVRTKTPDPYKTRFQKQKEELLGRNGKGSRSKAADLERLTLGTIRSSAKPNTNKDKRTTPSRLVQRKSKDSANDHNDKFSTTVLGEFELDKSTTSGDIIVLGNREYRVETARCQYKYAGGQRFVMVRKILEVKELTRAQNEEAILRQYNSSPSSSSSITEDLT